MHLKFLQIKRSDRLTSAGLVSSMVWQSYGPMSVGRFKIR